MESSGEKVLMRNHMEAVASQMLDEMLPGTGICSCERCRMDIMAYALNLLPPRYVVTEKGDLYSRISEFNQQFEIDVKIALAKAIETVKKNPRH